MTVLDFCKQRQLQTQRVLKYIQRNSELFDGHITKVGQQTELDETAWELLDKKYPVPPELVVIPAEELQKQLAAAKDYIIVLQQQAIENEKQLAKAQLDAIMLEESSRQLLEAKAVNADLQTACNGLQQEVGKLTAQVEASQKAAEEAAEEVERLRSRSLLQRILNK